MRVLIATTAGSGHFGPMLPFAGALRDAGHAVRVAAPASFGPAVERAGFVHEPFPDADPAALGAIFGSLQGVTNEEGNQVVARDVFGRVDAQAAMPGMQAIVDRWRPDIVVRESAEISSYVVAEATGVPHVQVAVGLTSFEARFLQVLEEPLRELGSASGVAGLLAAPRLSLLPQSFDPESTATTRRFRADPPPAGDGLPDWWGGSGAPLVYMTFGSVTASMGTFAGVYPEAVAAVAGLPIRVLLTTGEGIGVDALQPLPPNVHVERWWPQADVMPHAAAMVGHGGLGTTLHGLAAGVPQAVVPIFADQPHNAGRVAALAPVSSSTAPPG
ncbi:MAG: glycosyltransferase [Acidimicrobiales bacterium]